MGDVFENLRNMCLELYQVDPAKFLSAPGLAWQAALNKIKLKLKLLTDIYMLFMVEKELEVEYATLLIDMQKLIINIWKITIIKKCSILNIGM